MAREWGEMNKGLVSGMKFSDNSVSRTENRSESVASENKRCRARYLTQTCVGRCRSRLPAVRDIC